MISIYYYEAPNGLDVPGLVDRIDLPNVYRVIARPNTKSIHGMAGDLLRSRGVDRDLYRKSAGVDTLLALAAAWGLAYGITDVYVGESQDMLESNVLDTIEFAHRFGANIHFVFSHGETHTHAERIIRYGGELRPFTDLPIQIRQPENHPAPAPDSEEFAAARVWPEYTGGEWMTYRAGYLAVFNDGAARAADHVYFDAYNTFRTSNPTTPEDAATIAGELWVRHGIDPFVVETIAAAMQAAMWTNGFHTKVDPVIFERFIRRFRANGMTRAHYKRMTAYPDPWRSAATVLHAQRVPIDIIINLSTSDVTSHGQIPSLDLDLPEEAAVLIAAQRWNQILRAKDPIPPLIGRNINSVRQGIKKVIRELELPLSGSFTSPGNERYVPRIGVQMAVYA